MHELPDSLLRVAVEHPRVVPVEQVVLDPGEALPLAALKDDDVFRLFDIKDWHAEERAALPVRRRVDDVVGPNDEDDVGAWELRVHLVPVEEVVVGDPCLGEQDVHVPGHPPGDRVDRELHLDVLAFEQVGQLLNLLLGLGDRHAVAWGNDHLVRVGEHDRDVVSLDRLHAALDLHPFLLRRAESAEEDVRDRAVHRPRHLEREQRTCGADNDARDDHCIVGSREREPVERDGEPGEGIVHRDHDRHVGSTDRECHKEPEPEREAEEQREIHGDGERDPGQVPEDEHTGHDGEGQDRHVDDLLTLEGDRPLPHPALELQERDEAPCKRNRSNEATNDSEGTGSGGGGAEERDSRDPGRCASAHAIVERDHLGHIGHRDAFRRDVAEAPADDDRKCYQGEVGEVRGKERDERRDQHRGAGPDNPAPSSERVAHPLQADDEEKDCRNVDRVDRVGEVDHLTSPFRASSRCGRTSGGSAP